MPFNKGISHFSLDLPYSKSHAMPGMVAHAYNSSTRRGVEAEAEDCEFESSLGYIVRSCLKKTNK
jgi:hypothetical protein